MTQELPQQALHWLCLSAGCESHTVALSMGSVARTLTSRLVQPHW